MAPKPRKAMARDAIPDTPMPVDLYRFALNARWLPLFDATLPTPDQPMSGMERAA
ncbi:hypothetical protein [Polaromonas sp. OV174]|uniref:hypothetical protein n=1 Tax=Polaromonas sp. OV174 TaxID=1855300 RepID=UPI0015A6394D|nr:hypothetical protein [Polaromonas sp. OV174]